VVERRQFQENIAKTCLRGNTLVVIPTGLGKTVIAALVAAERLKQHPQGRCLILAPTRPLVLQHLRTFKSIIKLSEDDFCVFTGETPPEKRSKAECKLLFLTPQVLENDLVAGRINLENVVLIVFDEAHRCVGNYAYVFIAEQFLRQSKNPLILGLTASPGSSREKIEEIKKSLNIQFIEARSEDSPDVKPYVMPLRIEWVPVELSPAFKEIKFNLESYLKERIEAVKKAGFLTAMPQNRLTYRDFSTATENIKAEMAKYPTPPPETRSAMVDLTAAKRVSHAIELLETQGLATLRKYFEKIETAAKRPGVALSIKKILADGRIQTAISLTLAYDQRGAEHPKLEKLIEYLKKSLAEQARRIIIFTNYRETARKLTDKLNNLEGVKAVRLIGQSDKPDDAGLSQQMQTQLLTAFREGQFNVLVATQVAEEGIDISSSDVVIFYDNVPSAIRFIQRRGRTARRSPGKVIILIARDTRDEAYYWISQRKEKIMRQILAEMQADSRMAVEKAQPKLETFIAPVKNSSEMSGEEKLVIYVDSREGTSQVARELIRVGVEVKLTNLAVGDYVLSERTCVERKTAEDFAASIIDKRLFIQVKELTSTYNQPLLIIEGENMYSAGGISAQAVRGAVASLILDFKIPIIWTRTPTETALMLYTIARKEQVEKHVHIAIRGEKKPLTLSEQQEFVVAGLPNIEATLAKRLLSKFGSVEKVFTASEHDLQKVPGIGEIIAQKIRKVITEKYEVPYEEQN
jgi:Fanconi anemia group M protein